jgi:hypothetical protein
MNKDFLFEDWYSIEGWKYCKSKEIAYKIWQSIKE